MAELKQGWYRSNKKLHYFRDGEYGQGFLSFCGQRNFEGEKDESNPNIKTPDKCNFCYGKLKKEGWA